MTKNKLTKILYFKNKAIFKIVLFFMLSNIIIYSLNGLLFNINAKESHTFIKTSSVLNNQNREQEYDYKISSIKVNRKQALEEFFNSYNSPLAQNAQTFIDVADKYGLDYRLLPAISCMESTCAKFYIEGSYNPFGWGIYGNNSIGFSSFDEAIETVGEGIYTGYVVKGADEPHEIAPIYTPPNHVKWLSGVRFFMNKMSEFEQDNVLVS